MSLTRFRSKRGRPRAQPKPTHDHGTPELAAKRALHLTSDAVDWLFLHKKISEEQRHHAFRFRQLYHHRFGCPRVRALLLSNHESGTLISETDSKRMEHEYRHLARWLDPISLEWLLSVAVFGALNACREDGYKGFRDAINKMMRLQKRA